jgi:hypothetical protein
MARHMTAIWPGRPCFLASPTGSPATCRAGADEGDRPTARITRLRAANCLAKVSEVDQAAVRAEFWEIFDIDDHHAPGEEAVAEARRRARQFEATWGKQYPAAVATVVDSLDELVAHLHYPRAHWPRIRHTSLIERTFGETRRRVKVIGRLPGERSALSLLFAVLERAAGGWRGITYTPADVRLLQMIRRDLGLTTHRTEHLQPDPHRDEFLTVVKRESAPLAA